MAHYSLELDRQTIETVEKRKVVLLDTSVWIRLADGRTSQAISLRDRLLKLCADERVLCPLVAPTLWELRKQSSPSLERTAELMELLSLNVSFRGREQIFDHEVGHFFDYLRSGVFAPLTTSEKFGPLLCYLTPSFRLGAAPESVRDEHTQLYDLLASIVSNISLTKLISMLGERSFPNVETTCGYQATSRARRESLGSVAKIRRLEVEHIAQTVVIPKFNAIRSKLPIVEQLAILNQLKKLPQGRKNCGAIEHMLVFMPAISAYVEMLVGSGLDTNRKDNANDFFDREIFVYGLAYSSIFAAVDSWISSLVSHSKRSGYPGFFAFAGSLCELEKSLDIVVGAA